MKDSLTPGQYQGWVKYALQFNLSPEKEDTFWAIALADFRNVNAGIGASEVIPMDFLPWLDPYQGDSENLTVEDVLRECGLR
jgi:hypothetical protein